MIKVAIIYDFDGTLAPGNMQEHDFIPAVGKSAKEFWNEADSLAIEQDADSVLAYMERMITSAREHGLSLRREAFASLGKTIRFYRGVEEWFGRMNSFAAEHGIELVHYIDSSGLKEIIEGTPIASEFRKIYASSFLYDNDGNAYWPAVAINYTNKTQFIFKINKGVETVYDSELVNKHLPDKDRALPFERMIFIGDGLTDIPCMTLVRRSKGHSIAVYNPEKPGSRDKMMELIRDERVSHVCPADYSADREIERVVRHILCKMEADYKLSLLEP
ncbi:MAG: HAD family hydrolase [Rikenellaceae bacterium]